MIRESHDWPLSAQAFDALVRQQLPVLFRGGARDWPCTQRWNPEYLTRLIGARPVRVTLSNQPLFSMDPERGHYTPESLSSMRFDEFLEHITHPPASGHYYYLHKHSLQQQLPELLADIRVPPHLEGHAMLETALWMGPGGSITPIHHDFSDNFFVQVRGRKRVIMYAPEPERSFYRMPFRSYGQPRPRSSWHISRVGSLTSPDSNASFPEFARAEPLDVTCEPGDILYIPEFYWHEVHSLDSPSLSLSHWWSTYTVEQIEAKLQTITRFFEVYGEATPGWRSLVQRLARNHLEH